MFCGLVILYPVNWSQVILGTSIVTCAWAGAIVPTINARHDAGMNLLMVILLLGRRMLALRSSDPRRVAEPTWPGPFAAAALLPTAAPAYAARSSALRPSA